jgi:phosphatidylethanolamine N-methyltransferase
MDTGNTTGAHRQDEGLRERIPASQPVDVGAVDEALASAGYVTERETKDGEKSTMTFGRTPDGTSK